MSDNIILSLAIFGGAALLIKRSLAIARPDVIVTQNEVPTDTGEAWDPADLVGVSGVRAVEKIGSGYEQVLHMDDGGHCTTYAWDNPFEQVHQKNW